MKQSYREGTWFAVPLNQGGYAAGLLARMAPGGKVVLAYFYGPKRAALPTLAELAGMRPGDAVKVARTGDMGLANGRWQVIGDAPDWQRELWPIPAFIRRSEPVRHAWRAVYADTDPGRPEREVSVPYDMTGLDIDLLYGYGSIELLLTKLLA
ncbi:Imm26 family immunity protein [Rugamonas sp.]|uniref:Imm26 family immunity protein n=1 Tax=Rugamonas sp. TaxID=1926287 RepID=UPI0025E0FBCF|nr:Imm26 family immunity protein [Rugamonas sp.]